MSLHHADMKRPKMLISLYESVVAARGGVVDGKVNCVIPQREHEFPARSAVLTRPKWTEHATTLHFKDFGEHYEAEISPTFLQSYQ
eukprot:1099564-Amphidinium_carterae.1